MAEVLPRKRLAAFVLASARDTKSIVFPNLSTAR